MSDSFTPNKTFKQPRMARDFWKAMDAAITNENVTETLRIRARHLLPLRSNRPQPKGSLQQGSERIARRH